MPDQVTINSSINLGLPDKAPDDIKNPEVRAVYEFAINSINNLLRSIEQFTGITTKDITQWPQLRPPDTLLKQNLGRYYVRASENLAFGNFVNIHNNAGECNVQKANSIAKPAHGYCNIPNGAIAGQITEIILAQGILVILGLNAGDKIYLSNIPGVAGIAPDVAAGRIEQFLGLAVAPGIAYIDIAMGQYIQH